MSASALPAVSGTPYRRACRMSGLRAIPPKVVAEDAIEAQDTILDLFDHLPAQTLEQLREAGALERTAASTLGAVVCILETFLKQTFLRQVIGGDSLIARRGNIFQRLDDTALLYRDHCGIDIPAIGCGGTGSFGACSMASATWPPTPTP